MYIKSINNLRAVSIVLIVWSHTFWVSNYEPTTWPEHVFSFLFQGGTFYFLFISGFLFNHLVVSNFNYKKLLKAKFRNIASPYLFLSILPITLAVYMKTIYPEYFFTDGGQGLWLEYIKPAILYALSGRAITGYWYIPFILILFICSPLFVRYSKLASKIQIILLIIAIVISGFTFRATDNMNPFQALVYFTPMFMFGMLCSMNSEYLKKNVTKYAVLLVLISIALSIYQTLVLGIDSNIEKDMFTYGGFNITLSVKAIQLLGVYLLFEKYLSKEYKPLSLLASASFAIFFIHPFVIFVIKRIAPSEWSGLLYWQLLVVVTVAISLFIAWSIKKVLGKKSRYFTGW